MNMEKAKNRIKEINKVLWTILALNLIVSIMKLVVGYAISSASMVADGFHSFSDCSSNIIGLIGTALAAKPAETAASDNRHSLAMVMAAIESSHQARPVPVS